MVIACWSAKGGSGTTVVAAALAVILAGRSEPGATLVDLAGDVPAVLGLADSTGPGALDWCDSGASPDALRRLAVEAGRGLNVIPAGSGRGDSAGAIDEALARLASDGSPVVVDCGTLKPTGARLAVASSAHVSLLVTRPCYLALRRALAAPIRPSATVVVNEPQRALAPADVSDVLGVPVAAVVPYDPAVARAVDAGMLASRVPRVLSRSLRRAA